MLNAQCSMLNAQCSMLNAKSLERSYALSSGEGDRTMSPIVQLTRSALPLRMAYPIKQAGLAGRHLSRRSVGDIKCGSGANAFASHAAREAYTVSPLGQVFLLDPVGRSGGMMSSGMALIRNLSKCGTVKAA